MSKKLWTILVLLIALMLVLGACTGNDDSNSEDQDKI